MNANVSSIRQRVVRRSRHTGLTLIELVIVLVILAALAGLVIPQVAQLGRTSDMATSAKTQADLSSNIQLFFMLNKRYPQGFDSLLVDDGGTGTPTGVFLPQNDADGNQITGLPDSGPHLDEQLTMTDLPADVKGVSEFRRSLRRSGFDYVFDHDSSIANANDSGMHQRAIDGSSAIVATLMPDSQIARSLYPDKDGDGDADVPIGRELVAFGIGPSNAAIGKTLQNSPIYPGNAGSYYGRYVAIFEAYADGSRANLVVVTDSYGRFPDYTIKMFNETLPKDTARRG